MRTPPTMAVPFPSLMTCVPIAPAMSDHPHSDVLGVAGVTEIQRRGECRRDAAGTGAAHHGNAETDSQERHREEDELRQHHRPIRMPVAVVPAPTIFWICIGCQTPAARPTSVTVAASASSENCTTRLPEAPT